MTYERSVVMGSDRRFEIELTLWQENRDEWNELAERVVLLGGWWCERLDGATLKADVLLPPGTVADGQPSYTLPDETIIFMRPGGWTIRPGRPIAKLAYLALDIPGRTREELVAAVDYLKMCGARLVGAGSVGGTGPRRRPRPALVFDLAGKLNARPRLAGWAPATCSEKGDEYIWELNNRGLLRVRLGDGDWLVYRVEPSGSNELYDSLPRGRSEPLQRPSLVLPLIPPPPYPLEY